MKKLKPCDSGFPPLYYSLFGKFLFGCLASFYLVVWQVFIWLFGKFLLGYLVSIHLVIFHPDGRWHYRRVQHPQGHHRRDLQGRRQLPPPVTRPPQTRHPPTQLTKSRIGGCPYIYRLCPTVKPVEIATTPCVSPQEPSFFLRHPSYIFSSSSPTQQDTRLPYPRKPPNPKSMR